MVMEYLDGETLQRKIAGRPLEIELILKLATEITDALDAAHGEGIIHRDIKPGNIFVTRRGYAKVLDFGLAKVVIRAASSPASAGVESEIETADPDAGHLTGSGAMQGTIGYMSPEQVSARGLDARTDLFSFGAVLYDGDRQNAVHRFQSGGDLWRDSSPGACAALAAPPIESGQILFLNNFSPLFTAYIRGKAHLLGGQGVAAAAEFQKIVDHSGLVWNCWSGALVHLGLARANALQARNAKGADADAARVRALARGV